VYHCPTHTAVQHTAVRTSLYRRSADHRPRTLTQGLLSSSPWLLNTQQPLAAEPHPAAAAVSHRSSAHEHASRRFLPSDLVLGSTAAKLNRRKTFGEAPGLVLNWLYVHIMTRLRHMCKTSCKLTAASVRQLATLYSYCTRTGTGTRVRTVVRVRYSGRPCVCACAAAAAGWLLLHVHCSCHCSTDATMPLGTVSKMYGGAGVLGGPVRAPSAGGAAPASWRMMRRVGALPSGALPSASSEGRWCSTRRWRPRPRNVREPHSRLSSCALPDVRRVPPTGLGACVGR
jgi:hypothetical protein